MGVKKREILIDYEPTSYQQLFRNTIRELPIFFKNYFISTFPIIQWIHRYNLTVSLLHVFFS
jgi:sodium-independent sulfate anion transporter 11